ncbi:hypothetical protein BDK51DRAFT_33680 [Blyttiomyces helicus]|uniref:Uncharacterized protein n=1 Tax=Blyttiomyces helicus TaxID=388810 RepID=A0A4P9WGM0_9FUNG|nr:hypothetical protein BDK51DRAFT_33680 [Blyttiomyces helicus]|eukprot:RKO91492.1 hypothetical protein BDK51DRAFT_33680 [Blyttiomyces helicus]
MEKNSKVTVEPKKRGGKMRQKGGGQEMGKDGEDGERWGRWGKMGKEVAKEIRGSKKERRIEKKKKRSQEGKREKWEERWGSWGEMRGSKKERRIEKKKKRFQEGKREKWEELEGEAPGGSEVMLSGTRPGEAPKSPYIIRNGSGPELDRSNRVIKDHEIYDDPRVKKRRNNKSKRRKDGGWIQ